MAANALVSQQDCSLAKTESNPPTFTQILSVVSFHSASMAVYRQKGFAMTMPENLAFQPETSNQERNASDVVVSYPITNVESGDLKECGFTEIEMTYLTEYLPE